MHWPRRARKTRSITSVTVTILLVKSRQTSLTSELIALITSIWTSEALGSRHIAIPIIFWLTNMTSISFLTLETIHDIALLT